MTVKPIPDGYHTVTPYLVVADAEAQIDFLKNAGRRRGNLSSQRRQGQSQPCRGARGAENGKVRLGQDDAVGHVGFDQRAGEDLAGEVCRLVGVAFSATSAAAQAERDSVFAEHISQAFDFADIRD